MEFRCEGKVGAPVEVVYATVRDHLPRLVPFLENVERIEELERKPEGDGRLRLLNRWRADAGQVPPPVRPFLKPEMLEWLDHALWLDAEKAVDWRIEPSAFQGLYICQGRNHFTGDGANATLTIHGQLTLDPSRIPGVPTFLAKKVAPSVEAYLLERIKPNLVALATGVGKYLQSQG